MLATPHLCSQEIPWVCTPPFRPVMLNSPCSYGWCRNFWESLEGLCGWGGSLTMLWSSFLLGGMWKRPWACLTVKKPLFFSSKEPRDNCDCVQHLQVWMVNSICGCPFRIPSGWSSLVKCPQSSGMLRYWLALPSSTDFSRDTEEGKACNACPQLNFQPGNCRMHLQIVIQ